MIHGWRAQLWKSSLVLHTLLQIVICSTLDLTRTLMENTNLSPYLCQKLAELGCYSPTKYWRKQALSHHINYINRESFTAQQILILKTGHEPLWIQVPCWRETWVINWYNGRHTTWTNGLPSIIIVHGGFQKKGSVRKKTRKKLSPKPPKDALRKRSNVKRELGTWRWKVQRNLHRHRHHGSTQITFSRTVLGQSTTGWRPPPHRCWS